MDLGPLEAPVLGKLPAGVWHSRTEALWSAWREDPATGMYGPAELAAVLELAYLTDEFVSGGHPDLKFQRVTPAELRQRMDGLGLTAKGKRDLRWRTVAEVAHEEREPTRSSPVESRGHLRAV